MCSRRFTAKALTEMGFAAKVQSIRKSFSFKVRFELFTCAVYVRKKLFVLG